MRTGPEICPKCQGKRSALFTSYYCPRCDKTAAAPVPLWSVLTFEQVELYFNNLPDWDVADRSKWAMADVETFHVQRRSDGLSVSIHVPCTCPVDYVATWIALLRMWP